MRDINAFLRDFGVARHCTCVLFNTNAITREKVLGIDNQKDQKVLLVLYIAFAW